MGGDDRSYSRNVVRHYPIVINNLLAGTLYTHIKGAHEGLNAEVLL